jgi:hypothetical protein
MRFVTKYTVTDDPGLYPSQEMLGREDIPKAQLQRMREV